MPVISVRHLTIYRYKQPVAFGDHRMMLRPRDSYDQKLLDATFAITPEPVDIRWVHDVFGNCVAIARFAGRAAELRFESALMIDVGPMPSISRSRNTPKGTRSPTAPTKCPICCG